MHTRIAGCIFLILLQYAAFSQDIKDDLRLIKDRQFLEANEFAYYKRPGNDGNVLQTQKKSITARYNPASLILSGAMLLYQRVISPQLARNCPYEITCSNFSKQAIKEYGIVKGVFLSADRILRCNRIGILDVNPLDFNETNGTIVDSPVKYK